jgi:hypothetical protein
MSNTDWVARSIAVAGLLLQGYQHYQNRVRVRVYVEYDEGVARDPLGGGYDPYYKFVAANTGRQPITLKTVRIYNSTGGKSRPSDLKLNRPTQLQPTEEITFRFDVPGYVSIIKRIAILDTEGREWPITRRNLKFLKRHYLDQEERG